MKYEVLTLRHAQGHNDGSKRLGATKKVMALFEVGDGDGVHIVVGLIFSTHTPAERIVLRPNTGVYGPARRYHDFLIRDYKMAGSIGRPHQVHHAVGGVHIEVEIDLAATHV